ncbi:hypothetical protein BC830DRAFT_1142804 [Chytriomyces sp. MP71]|nr:hypothetical protein BC830DRAFT_1142804 [Chytriomyces sp. MP71]
MGLQSLDAFVANTTSYIPLTVPGTGFAFDAVECRPRPPSLQVLTHADSKNKQGGSATLAVSNFSAAAPVASNSNAAIPAVNVTKQILFAVCDQADFSFYDQTAANATLIRSQFCIALNRRLMTGCSILPFSALLSPGATSFVATVPLNSTYIYDAFIILCQDSGAPIITFEYAFQAVNPGPWFLRFLGSYDMQAFFIDSFFASAWCLATLTWLLNWVLHVNMRNKLHTLIGLIPVTRILYFSYKLSRYVLVGMGVADSRMLFHLKNAATFMVDAALMVCLGCMGKGWGVLRAHMSPLEKRSLGGVAISVGIADLLYSYDTGFMFAFWVFGLSAYYYLLWTTQIHLQNSEKYLAVLKAKMESVRASGGALTVAGSPTTARQRIAPARNISTNRDTSVGAVHVQGGAATPPPASAPRWFQRVRAEIGEWRQSVSWDMVFPKRPRFPRDAFGTRVCGVGEDWNLVWSMESKHWMMRSTNNIIIFYAFFTFTDKAIVFLGANVIPFYPTLPDLYLLLGFLWIASVFRLRQPEQLVVPPVWILGERTKVPTAVRLDAEGEGEGRRAIVMRDLRRMRPHGSIGQVVSRVWRRVFQAEE